MTPTNARLSQRIAHLRNAHDVHLQIGSAAIKAAPAIWAEDLLVLAALNRSLSLIDGFSRLVEADNPICAIPLIRFQLDSVLRLAACELGDAPSILKALLEGTPLGKVKGRDGKPLTDTRLHEHLSTRVSWVGSVYKAVSGHVHFSSPHLMACVAAVTDDTRTVQFAVSGPPGAQWKPEYWDEAVEAMVATTDLLLKACGSWAAAKADRAAGTQSRPPTSSSEVQS